MDIRDKSAINGGAKSPMLYHTFEDGSYEEIELPTKMEVCPVCDGHGKHTNPGIDAHGISAQEFAEDPDFAEEYFSGTYDVTCYECHGRNVVPVVDESRMTKDQITAWYKQLDEQDYYAREREAEMRMGA